MFKKCLTSQLCLVQQYFNGKDYSLAGQSLSMMRREEGRLTTIKMFEEIAWVE